MRNIFLFIAILFYTIQSKAQVIINPKGTKIIIDSSKWKIVGQNIYFKNTGNVGIGTTTPAAQLHTTAGVRFQGLSTNTTDTKIVTTDAAGNLNTRLVSSLPTNIDSTTSNNGLTLTGKNVQLGGSLIQATTIANNANPLTIATGGAALNITGLTAGASTDSILTVNTTTGKINRISLSIPNKVDSTTATNGLNLSGKDVRLGGALTQATIITNNANPLTIATGGAALNITGLTAGANTDSILTVNTTTGKINRISLSIPNKVDSTTASNGLNLVGKDVRLGGALTEATTINSNNQFLTFETGGTPLVINGLPNGLGTERLVVQDNVSGQLKTIVAPDVQTRIVQTIDIAGTQLLTTAFANLNLGTTTISDPGYTVTAGVITVINAGVYRVTYRVTANVTDNTNSGAEFRLFTGATQIPGSVGYTYHNNNNTTQGTTTVVLVGAIPANTTIALQGRRYTAAGALRLSANGSSFLIEKIR